MLCFSYAMGSFVSHSRKKDACHGSRVGLVVGDSRVGLVVGDSRVGFGVASKHRNHDDGHILPQILAADVLLSLIFHHGD